MALLLVQMVVAAAAGGDWTVVPKWNAIPSGDAAHIDSQDGCQAHCDSTPNCTQWTWNYGHKPKYYCFTSSSTEWGGLPSDHITSGCLAASVHNCGHPPPPPPSPPLPPNTPRWEVKGAPKGAEPFCGFKMVTPADGLVTTVVYNATLELGAYNHAAMLDYHNSTFFLTWKNSPVDEDTPGQRILFSYSVDGEGWPVTDGTNVLFPNMSTSANPAALFGGPTAILNGKRYATASPHQFCLFPYPYASSVTSTDPGNVLLLRRVDLGPNGAPPRLGPIFWASATIPQGFEAASAREGVVSSSAMDAETRADLAALENTAVPPCAGEDETLKCEACVGGCGNTTRCERTHYEVPLSSGDVILQRSRDHVLTFSSRPNSSAPWSADTPTTIPDVDANLNAGTLPNGRVFLVSNPCPDNEVVHGRDPLVVSSSRDGMVWDAAVGVMSCVSLGQCGPRYPGKAKGPGPSYPQAVTVLGPSAIEGLWVVATNNKEDVVVAKVPFAALNARVYQWQ